MCHTLPYRLFDAHLARKRDVSPYLARLTLAGPDLARMKTSAPDQRIKLFFPDPAGRAPALPKDDGWYQAYKKAPIEQRPPMRTYTIRNLRADEEELDVDFVLHGTNGPASRWALEAQRGAKLQIAAPNRCFAGDPGGYEWRLPAHARHVLLMADETALPAAAGILQSLAASQRRIRVEAYLEVPTRADCVGVAPFDGLLLTWLPRDEANGPTPEGSLMAAAARRARVPVPAGADGAGPALAALDPDREIVWERAAPIAHDDFYAWVAGEAEAVMQIRRTLVKEHGLDRRTMNLMGYWRRGRALDD